MLDGTVYTCFIVILKTQWDVLYKKNFCWLFYKTIKMHGTCIKIIKIMCI